VTEIGFLVIGAAKAGTTSLFEYMRLHPDLHMPPEKEVYFFNIDRNYRRGLDWYRETVCRDAPPGAICGEATAEYLSGTSYAEGAEDRDLAPSNWNVEVTEVEETIPRRIREALPDVRLICVLRDPVERAHSHYRMMALGGVDSRSFDAAVEELMEPGTLERSRIARTRLNGYVVNGEYARLLAGYLRVFPRTQLKAIFSDDLQERPDETMADLFEFIGVTPEFVPQNVGTRYREAAVRQRIPGLNLVTLQTGLARLGVARKLWHALPDRPRNTIDRAYNVVNYRVEMWNALRGEAGEEIPEHVRDRLVAHYRPDSEALAEMLGREVPWLASWSRRPVPTS
jgi:Sulfotransferase domain